MVCPIFAKQEIVMSSYVSSIMFQEEKEKEELEREREAEQRRMAEAMAGMEGAVNTTAVPASTLLNISETEPQPTPAAAATSQHKY